MILDLHRQGLSVSAISRQLGIDRKTVRRYVARGLEPPKYKPRVPQPGVIDPFRSYLAERITSFRR
jgi:transposase